MKTFNRIPLSEVREKKQIKDEIKNNVKNLQTENSNLKLAFAEYIEENDLDKTDMSLALAEALEGGAL